MKNFLLGVTIAACYLIVSTLDYNDQFDRVEQVKYTDDYILFLQQSGIVECDTDIDCEVKNPNLKGN